MLIGSVIVGGLAEIRDAVRRGTGEIKPYIFRVRISFSFNKSLMPSKSPDRHWGAKNQTRVLTPAQVRESPNKINVTGVITPMANQELTWSTIAKQKTMTAP